MVEGLSVEFVVKGFVLFEVEGEEVPKGDAGDAGDAGLANGLGLVELPPAEPVRGFDKPNGLGWAD